MLPDSSTSSNNIQLVCFATFLNWPYTIDSSNLEIQGDSIHLFIHYLGGNVLFPAQAGQIDTLLIGNLPPGNYFLKLNADRSDLMSSHAPDSLSINFSVGTLGLKETKIDSIYLYPNPATNQLNFSIPALSNNLKVTISDISGRTIKTIGYKASNNGVYNQTIDISNLSRGLYLCNFNYDGKNITRKFVKQ